MLAEWFEFRALLMALKTQGLLDTGEYVVVGVDPNQYDSSDTQKYITGQYVVVGVDPNQYDSSDTQKYITGQYVVVGVDPSQYDSSDTQKYITGQRRHYTRTLCMIS